jgi:prepilin-type N-terminal cleavage/methylation domain-containing protein
MVAVVGASTRAGTGPAYVGVTLADSPPRHLPINRNHHTMLRKLNTKREGFTLVEIMIVVAIIALLAAIAVPNFLRSRKRSQATQILEDLRILDAAIDQYAIEYNRGGNGANGAFVWSDLMKYVKTGTRLYTTMGTNAPLDILGYSFVANSSIDSPTRLLVNLGSYNALSDVVPMGFWSPFGY